MKTNSEPPLIENENGALVPVQKSKELENSINTFSKPLANYLTDIGLPTEDVLYSYDERRIVINALEDALSVLPMDERAKAHYLTKFTVAVAVGLLDGALNYLWNETVRAIRNLVVKFDLEYFFSVAEKISTKNKNLATTEELEQIGDHDLLEACRRIGLVSDVNYRRLEHVNYMRNHASAAHPSDETISGYEILSWLSICLKHAITAEPDHSVIKIKVLLENIRTQTIPTADFQVISSDIAKQPRERVDDLLWALFGMFTDPRIQPQAKSNIIGIAKCVWDTSSEDRKYEVGSKFGVFRKNADILRKEAAQEFLEIVDGVGYKDEDSIAGELLEKLETLKRVHYAFNNFYNEYHHATILKTSLPVTGKIPRAARPTWVKVICTCFIGNGLGYREGVDENALPYYQEFIGNFSEIEIVEFLHLMNDTEFTAPLTNSKTDARTRELVCILKAKTENLHIQRALGIIESGPFKNLDQVMYITDYEKVMTFIPKP